MIVSPLRLINRQPMAFGTCHSRHSDNSDPGMQHAGQTLDLASWTDPGYMGDTVSSMASAA
jgi:hypothetical protein